MTGAFEPGDIVRRIPKGGTQFWGLQADCTGVVVEVIGDAVYVEGYGDWPHHAETLEKI